MAEELKTNVDTSTDEKKSGRKKRYALSVEESKKTFGVCCNPECGRPYKKGKSFPKEVCGACKKAGVKFDKKWLTKDGKPRKNKKFAGMMSSLDHVLKEDDESFEIAPGEAIKKKHKKMWERAKARARENPEDEEVETEQVSTEESDGGED